MARTTAAERIQYRRRVEIDAEMIMRTVGWHQDESRCAARPAGGFGALPARKLTVRQISTRTANTPVAHGEALSFLLARPLPSGTSFLPCLPVPFLATGSSSADVSVPRLAGFSLIT